ncbi:Eco57I restriction-modification methylase domain-containing protein [Streptomyces radicis]|uniref:site-specific DNA-methyltransferase (adenine-specific) n=1 Tax=Streptomyces radicis TaxID=1750517 RepID=A0A3A9WPT8_9ACTN|nr:DNA methyltransferase [Streptomyces radicis]RKN08187.1 SAM-dependent DNA methyltransferase [Streptomyces radicis]RKN20542.1 SAM-dependent DNA methyltransferase [Streptomyces radicis]
MSLAKTIVTDSVLTVGGLLPPDMLTRVRDGKDVPGAHPKDYGLFAVNDTVRDAAERSWAYLKGVWTAYQEALGKDGALDTTGIPAVGVTVERWLLPLFEQLGYGRLPDALAEGLPSADGEKRFRVSHVWQAVPVHLTGWNVELDRRTPSLPGPAPQSLLQEYLNRSGPDTLWGVLSNGRLLRLLRDSTSLVGSAYVEFDVEAIFEGDRFADFLLLWRLTHRSRFEPRGESGVAACWLEKWRTEAIASGTRAMEQLRLGVEKALVTLGSGFIQHRDNAEFRRKLDESEVTVRAMHPALLHLVYRLLFLFVAEDRGLLIPDDAPAEARERYEKYFSTARLRRTATRRTGGPHGDQWHALRLVLEGLGQEGGRPELGLPGLGGLFERAEADAVLDDLELPNEALYTAVKALSVVIDPKLNRPRRVDYRHLGAEELGSIYESLLELVPRFNPVANTFELRTLAGNERKTTGSYYTPSSLIDCLLDSALDPVIDDAVKSGATREEQEAALLRLTVCDPACGSGHFLVAAARRIAKRLAAVRTDSPEPSAEATRTALRDVISRCVYGADLNPMAVELAKVSLWIESLEPGKPLSFLDSHIKHGNGLVGATPKLLAEGLPDDAFKPIEGDEKKWVTGLRKRNQAEREAWKARLAGVHQGELFGATTALAASNVKLGKAAAGITTARNDKLEYVHKQRDAYAELMEGPDSEYVRERDLADAWCAAFVWEKTEEARPPALTLEGLLGLREGGWKKLPEGTREKVAELRNAYRFFHWHLEFPDVFSVPDDPDASSAVGVDERTGWGGGFSCVLGNPPWERVKLQEQEFFATRSEKIATAANKAARERLIRALATSEEPAERALLKDFVAAKRQAEGVSHLLRDSGRFPLAGRGDVNTYAVFAETASLGIASHGRFGLVLPTGIATDATTAPFFSDLVRSARLASFLDFENEAFLLSRAVHHSVRFCLLTVAGREERVREASFAFGTRYMEDLPSRRFSMPPEEILLVNPNTGTLPVFRSRRDAEITLGIYRRVPVLIREGDPEGNPWGLSFMRMFDMSNDSHLFRTQEQLAVEGWTLNGNVFERDGKRYLPLYEAKMLHHYDHRLGTYERQTEAQANMGTLPRVTAEQHDDPGFVPMPRYWVPEFDVETGKRDRKGNPVKESGVASRLAEREWYRGWLMGWRDIARGTDTRTTMLTALPPYGVGHTYPLLFPEDATAAALLQTCLSSFAFDYAIRQKIAGTHLTYGYLYQLPVPQPAELGVLHVADDWIMLRVAELAYTSHDMADYACDLGDDGPPFRWHEPRRELLRAELDAAFFHLYGLDRDEVEHVMETFPIVKREDEATHGTYRTKDLILDIYDRMAEARVTGTPYQTILDPPPGQGPRHPA